MVIALVMVIFKKLKSVVLFLVTLWRRAMCCFRRRRRPSDDFVPLTQIGVIANQNPSANDAEKWSDWGDLNNEANRKPETVQEHIQQYRQQAITSRQAQEEPLERQENFFQDMTPKITRQAKLFVNDNDNIEDHVTRLTLDANSVALVGNELGEWEENLGWEGQTLDWDAQAALREKRKLERERRAVEQHHRRQEKITKQYPLGARLSS